MARYQLLNYRGCLGNTTKGAPWASKTEAKAKTAPSPASIAVMKAVCGEHFAGQLKVQDPKTSHTFSCTFGDSCRFAHDDISKWTEDKKSATASTLAYRLRQPSLDALGKIKNGKTCVWLPEESEERLNRVREVLSIIPPVLIDEISSMVDSYFSRWSRLPRSYLEAVVSEAIAASDEQYVVDTAVAWAGGYTFPRAMLLSDMKCFQATQLDLVVTARRRLKILSGDRPSSARVERLR